MEAKRPNTMLDFIFGTNDYGKNEPRTRRVTDKREYSWDRVLQDNDVI
jgi:hypothetical protein